MESATLRKFTGQFAPALSCVFNCLRVLVLLEPVDPIFRGLSIWTMILKSGLLKARASQSISQIQKRETEEIELKGSVERATVKVPIFVGTTLYNIRPRLRTHFRIRPDVQPQYVCGHRVLEVFQPLRNWGFNQRFAQNALDASCRRTPPSPLLRRNCFHRHLLGEGRTDPKIFEHAKC